MGSKVQFKTAYIPNLQDGKVNYSLKITLSNDIKSFTRALM
jgi:hypothetical protein